MDKEIPKSELPKPFRKLSLRVSKSHLPGNESYKGERRMATYAQHR